MASRVREEEKIIVQCKNPYRGMMFRDWSQFDAMVFTFKKPMKKPIHTWFCKEMMVLLYLDNEIVDKRLMKPFEYYRPKSIYNKIIEHNPNVFIEA